MRSLLGVLVVAACVLVLVSPSAQSAYSQVLYTLKVSFSPSYDTRGLDGCTRPAYMPIYSGGTDTSHRARVEVGMLDKCASSLLTQLSVRGSQQEWKLDEYGLGLSTGPAPLPFVFWGGSASLFLTITYPHGSLKGFTIGAIRMYYSNKGTLWSVGSVYGLNASNNTWGEITDLSSSTGPCVLLWDLPGRHAWSGDINKISVGGVTNRIQQLEIRAEGAAQISIESIELDICQVVGR